MFGSGAPCACARRVACGRSRTATSPCPCTWTEASGRPSTSSRRGGMAIHPPNPALARPDAESALGSDREAVELHLARVLQSPPFARAPRMQRFLSFLIEETLAGRGSQLKEYTVAVAVFGKPPEFEPGTSAIVRVEAGRLRKLLMEYAVEHGRAD